MNNKFNKILIAGIATAALFSANSAQAACGDFTPAALKAALVTVVSGNTSAGFNLPMWMTFVDETGVTCAVVTSGTDGASLNPGVSVGRDKWLGSRVISAQKANTANAFSLNGVSISSGALFAAVQPGASLFGLQESNPVDATSAYAGNANLFGTGATDPMVTHRIGGVNVFGGGLAVYVGGKKRGAIGVSGDTSCTDHAVAWQVRTLLAADPGYADFPAGGGFERLNIATTYSALGDHPDCPLSTGLNNSASLGYK